MEKQIKKYILEGKTINADKALQNAISMPLKAIRSAKKKNEKEKGYFYRQ